METRNLDVGGRSIACRRLTMGDMVTLAGVLHERNAAKLTARLSALYAAAGIEEGKLPIVVAELTREPSTSETWRWLFTPIGNRHAAAVMAGVKPEDVDGWPAALDIAELVNWGLGVGRGEAGDGSIPLSKTSGEAAETST